MRKYSVIFFILIANVNFSFQQVNVHIYYSQICIDQLFVFVQHPTIKFITEADNFLERIFTNIVAKLNVENLPEYAREDGQDIINEFKDNLRDCKTELDRTQNIGNFKICTNKQIEVAENQLWDFRNSLDASSSNSSAFFVLLIPLIVGFSYLIF